MSLVLWRPQTPRMDIMERWHGIRNLDFLFPNPPPHPKKKAQMFDCFWGMFLLVSNMAVFFFTVFSNRAFFFWTATSKTLKSQNWYSTDLSVWPIWKAPQPLPRLQLSWAWELTNRPWTFYSVSTFSQKDKQMLPWFESPENIEGRALLNWFIHCAVMAFETFSSLGPLWFGVCRWYQPPTRLRMYIFDKPTDQNYV